MSKENDLSVRLEMDDIHHIGSIQDCGYVIGITAADDGTIQIVSVSDNLVNAKWASVANAENLLGKKLSEAFDSAIAVPIINLVHRYLSITGERLKHMSMGSVRNFELLNVLCKGVPVQLDEHFVCCSVVGSNNNIMLLELEDIDKEEAFSLRMPNSQILQSGDIVGRIRAMDSVESVAATFCDAIMETMPCYDRGMVYRFAEDDTGEVIYEKINNPSKVTSSFLNLRFPAADIPPVARQLFLKNGLRFLFDVHGAESALLSLNKEPLDLSMSTLRYANKCHLQYLGYMGVKSSLTIAIVVDNRLWGLYAIHSYTGPTKPTVEQRIMLEITGSISSMRIDTFLREKAASRKLELSDLMLKQELSSSVYEFLQKYSQSILSMLDAHCLVVHDGDDSRLCFGDDTILPTQEGYKKLAENQTQNVPISYNEFSKYLSGNGAGILCYRHQSTWLGLIRRSALCDVLWAGSLDQSEVATDAKYGDLCPRTSFEQYAEKARRESKIWSKFDLEISDSFFERMTHMLHRELLVSFRQSLDQSNAECVHALQTAKENYEFFAHMSHELRTPFHGVMSSLQILQESSDKIPASEQQEIVSAALECSKNMLHTLNDILDVAKSRNSSELLKVPVAISKLLTSTYRTMHPLADVKHIGFKLTEHATTLAGGDWKSVIMLSDPSRISQILNNFTNNALKFTSPEGIVSIETYLVSPSDVDAVFDSACAEYENSHTVLDKRVKVENKTDELDGYFMLRVSDTGCGVDAASLSTMFEAYKQVSSGVEKTFQGTGLGLHIVFLHMDALKGKLLAASTEAKGTMFLCAIPAELVQDRKGLIVHTTSDEMKITIGDSKKEDFDKARVKGAQILVVDDSSVNLRLSKRKLQIAMGDDLVVDFAVDGLEAVEAVTRKYELDAKKRPYSVILMDYHMPNCSGNEAIKRIRTLEKSLHVTDAVPIIAFTADLSQTSTEELLQAGANDVMAKPAPQGSIESACYSLALRRNE